jgi:hypothetical protein
MGPAARTADLFTDQQAVGDQRVPRGRATSRNAAARHTPALISAALMTAKVLLPTAAVAIRRGRAQHRRMRRNGQQQPDQQPRFAAQSPR